MDIKKYLVDPLANARILVIFVGLLHLFIATVHFNPIKNIMQGEIKFFGIFTLDNRLSGLFVFLFILLGLINLFNLLRLKNPNQKNTMLSMICLLITLFIGLVLLIFYFEAVANQPNVSSDHKIMNMFAKAIVLNIGCLLVYMVSFVQLVRVYIDIKKHAKRS